MDYKRIALYVAFALVVLNLWEKWESRVVTPPASATTTQQQLADNGTAAATAPSVVANNTGDNEVEPSTTTVKTESSPRAKTRITAPGHNATTIPQKRVITIKTSLLNLGVDLSGGRIINADLSKYPLVLHSKKPVNLINYNATEHYSAIADLVGFSKGLLQYNTAQSSYELVKGQKVLNVSMKAQANGLQVTKVLTFKPNSYLIGVSYKITNRSQQKKSGHLSLQISRSDVAPPRDSTFRMHTFYGLALYTPRAGYQSYKFSKLKNENVSLRGNNGWITMTQHYFLTAWIAQSGAAYHYFTQVSRDGIYTIVADSPTVSIAPSDTVNMSTQAYIGPKITSRLDAAAPALSKTIDYGWLWPISILIFWIMKHIHDLLGNWGWSIIIVTAVIKLAFWRLSAKSYRSMAAMRALQPKIAALKERLGGDKQAFGREMMALYKKEKVNPLGGFLPILVQIPFFIALYWVLIATVELRQAPFIFWIHDLSAKDPYYIFPVIMGLTMFLQQKLSPPPPDPTQAKIMLFLPIFVTAIFINFPTGLVLYMLVNNILSISQQAWVTHRHGKGFYKKQDDSWSKKKKADRKKR